MTIFPYVILILPERIHIGSHVVLSEFCWLHGGRSANVGSFVHFGSHTTVSGGGYLLVEDFVTISTGSRIINGSEMLNGEGLANHTIPSRYRAVERSFVHLRKHAFIGTNVVIHPGVTIGEGAVVGSGSIVTKDISDWTVNVGAPARPVKHRDPNRILELEQHIYKDMEVQPFPVEKYLNMKVKYQSLPEILE